MYILLDDLFDLNQDCCRVIWFWVRWIVRFKLGLSETSEPLLTRRHSDVIKRFETSLARHPNFTRVTHRSHMSVVDLLDVLITAASEALIGRVFKQSRCGFSSVSHLLLCVRVRASMCIWVRDYGLRQRLCTAGIIWPWCSSVVMWSSDNLTHGVCLETCAYCKKIEFRM